MWTESGALDDVASCLSVFDMIHALSLCIGVRCLVSLQRDPVRSYFYVFILSDNNLVVCV